MRKTVIAATGFGLTLMLFLVANVVAIQVMSDCGILGALGRAGCADDISRAGFPFQFWEQGGFIYRANFEPLALGLDIGLALGISLAVAGLCYWFWPKGQPDNAPGATPKMR